MKRTYLPALRTFLALVFVGCLGIAGCGGDTTGPDTSGPKGFILKAGGVEKAKMTTAGMTGALQINRPLGSGGHAVRSELLELTLTLADGSTYTPQTGDSLEVIPAEPKFLGVERIPGNQFQFYLLGKGGGATTVKFNLVRGGSNLIFTSGLVPVTVVTNGVEVTKLNAVVSPTNDVATVTDTVVLGLLTASSLGAPRVFTLELYNANEDQLRFFDNPSIQATAQIGDTSLATAVIDPVDPTSFNVVGKKVGKTYIVFTIMHTGGADGDYEIFQTPHIELDVR